jgi:hypothetical protein
MHQCPFPTFMQCIFGSLLGNSPFFLGLPLPLLFGIKSGKTLPYNIFPTSIFFLLFLKKKEKKKAKHVEIIGGEL